MNGLQIKHKMFISIFVPIVMLLVIGFIAINMMSKIEAGVASIYTNRMIPIDNLKVISDKYAVDVVDSINKANAGGINAAKALEVISNATITIEKNWNKYLTSEITDEEAKLVQQAETLFKRAEKAITEIMSQLEVIDGDVTHKLNSEILHMYKELDPINGKISELIELQIRVASQEKDEVREVYNTSIQVFFGLSIAAMVIASATGLWVNRSVMTPIDDILDKLNTVHQESDLTVQFSPLSNDELGKISTSLSKVTKHLRGVLHSIAEAATTINSSAADLSNFTQITSERMQQQQAETEQTATAMNEMTATVVEVAQSAASAAGSAKDADNYAANGNTIVGQSIDSMSDLNEQIQKTATVISFLETESTNIGRVLDVIKSIAEQTNLLALNAAIEAARAGEQGRGFAVVADEVRTLAQRTQKSTQEIETMIASLQKGVKEAVSAMETGTSQVDNANSKAKMAGEALHKIVASVDKITELNTHIATAAEEQSSVAEGINRSIIAISDIAEESTDSTTKLNASVSDLTQLASSMRSQVNKFKL